LYCLKTISGNTSHILCFDGVCAANAVSDVTNACQYICGQDSCLDAVDPGVCDMTHLLPGYTGAKYTCVNGNSILKWHHDTQHNDIENNKKTDIQH